MGLSVLFFMSELGWEVINREGAGFDDSEIAFPPTSHAVDP